MRAAQEQQQQDHHHHYRTTPSHSSDTPISLHHNDDDHDDAPIITNVDEQGNELLLTATTTTTEDNAASSSSSSSPMITTQKQEEKQRVIESSTEEEEEEKSNDLFECNICFDPANEPVITVCGHLFCWPCLYKWLNAQQNRSWQCPVCKAGIEKDKIIPIYGRGGDSKQKSANIQRGPSTTDSEPNSAESSNNGDGEGSIPSRPRGQRPNAPPNPNYNPFHAHQNIPFANPFGGMMGGGGFGGGFGGGGNLQFSDGFSFFPFFGLGVQTWSFGWNSSTGSTGAGAMNNGTPVSDQDLFDDEALQRAFYSRLLMLLGIIVLLVVIFL